MKRSVGNVGNELGSRKLLDQLELQLEELETEAGENNERLDAHAVLLHHRVAGGGLAEPRGA